MYEPGRRLAHAKGNVQRGRVDGQSETRPGRARIAVVLVFGLPHRLEPLGHRQRVAASGVVALEPRQATAGRDLVTARGWIPGPAWRPVGVLRPLDLGHDDSPVR